MTTPGQRPFSAYLRLWAIANLLRISIGLNAGTGLVGSTLDANFFSLATLPALVALAGLVPARWSGALPLVALVARAATNAAKGSMMSNSQMWATQMDGALVLSLLRRLGSAARHGSSWSSPLSAEDERAVVGGCARTVRWQLAIFYFASGFWKANTSFLHPSYSCAGLFMVQPLEYLPDDVLFAASGLAASAVPALARAIAATGPAFTLVLEAVVPVLHFLEPRRFPRCALFGLVLTLAFHLVIGLTPPPSNVSTYGVTTCTRLFFVLPDAAAAALGEMGRPHTAAGALLCASMAAAAAATLALVEPFHAVAISTVQGEGKDWHAGWYAALAVLLMRAAVLEAAGGGEGGPPAEKEKSREVEGRTREGPALRGLVALALLYAFALPVAGLQEKAGCLMFSQLRLHGGSNHLLLPTSLLQREFASAEPTNAFAGGVVRIEATDLEWVGNTFAEHMGPRTLRLIREVAAVPAEYVWAAKSSSAKRSRPPPRFRRHTLSALGLRRLLATAARQKDSFSLRYTRLHGAVGDEAWRTGSAGSEYVVRGEGGVTRCARLGLGGKESPCDAREEALIAPPSWPSSAFAFLLEPQPNPIVDGYTDEMHCVTWG